MPTYLVHGFRWPRPLIRIHIILQNLDDAASEWLMAPVTTRTLVKNFTTLHPQIMENLPELKFIEQYDPMDESAESKSQPYAYVADMVHEVKLGVEIDEVRGKGISHERWAAMVDLRDAIAPGEKVAWFVVVCGDAERWAPPTMQVLENSNTLLSRNETGGADNGTAQDPGQEESSKKSRSKFSKFFSRGDKTPRRTQSSKNLSAQASSRPQTSKTVSGSYTQQAPPMPQMQQIQTGHQQATSVPTTSSPRSINGSSTSTAVFHYPNGRSSTNTATPTRTSVANVAAPTIVQPSALPSAMGQASSGRAGGMPGRRQMHSASHSRSHSQSQHSLSPSMSMSPSDGGNTSHSTSPVVSNPVQSFKTPITTRLHNSNPGQVFSQHNQQAIAAATAAVSATSKAPVNFQPQSASVNGTASRLQPSLSTAPTIGQTSALPPSTSPPPTKDLPVPPGGVTAVLAGKEVQGNSGTGSIPTSGYGKATMI